MSDSSELLDTLKSDLFGRVERVRTGDRVLVRRDTRCARWWLRPLARALAAREARALAAAPVAGIPGLVSWREGVLLRTWIDGQPMHKARPRDRAYFGQCLRLVARMHRAGLVHNDLAKEPNWLVTPEHRPALIDFQLAWVAKRRGSLFHLLAREDLRHLLKHKRTYCPQALTQRERLILERPTWLARAWMATGKRLYLLITRRLLGWADREGAGDRNR